MSTYPAPQITQQHRSLRAPLPAATEAAPAPALETLLASFPNLPARTAILGVGRDGLPVLFDLQDDRPGAILICADRAAGKTGLLQTLLLSTLALSLPHEAQFVVIAAAESEWDWLTGDPLAGRYVLDVALPHDPAAAGWILRLAGMAEARSKGLQSGPTLLLLLDGVEFLAEADAGVRTAFEYLLANGPAVGIWPVGTLTPAAGRLHPLAGRFQTHILGRIRDREVARSFGLTGDAAYEALQAGARFAVLVNADWFVFDLPALEESQTWR